VAITNAGSVYVYVCPKSIIFIRYARKVDLLCLLCQIIFDVIDRK